MNLTEQTVKCPICGEPYIFYAFSAADQSACPRCVAKARENQGEWVDDVGWKEKKNESTNASKK